MSTPVLIHVRFAPDGVVADISERPQEVTGQRWFDALTEKFGEDYQPLSGGRGAFRVTREALDGLRAALAATPAT